MQKEKLQGLFIYIEIFIASQIDINTKTKQFKENKLIKMEFYQRLIFIPAVMSIFNFENYLLDENLRFFFPGYSYHFSSQKQPQNYLCFGLGFKLSNSVRLIKNQMKDLRKISEFHIYVGTQDKSTLWKSVLGETSNCVRSKTNFC